MITSFFLNLMAYFFSAIAFVLPTFEVWPQALIDGLTYICAAFAKLNFILPIDTLFTALLWFVHFNALYFTAKLSLKAINFIRGTGSGIDLK